MLSTKDRAETCKDQIRAFLASNFYMADADALESHTSLLDQGIVDSAGVLEVIGFIEETFGITVEDSELLPRESRFHPRNCAIYSPQAKLIADILPSVVLRRRQRNRACRSLATLTLAAWYVP